MNDIESCHKKILDQQKKFVVYHPLTHRHFSTLQQVVIDQLWNMRLIFQQNINKCILINGCSLWKINTEGEINFHFNYSKF